jgi:hypothetical protein
MMPLKTYTPNYAEAITASNGFLKVISKVASITLDMSI